MLDDWYRRESGNSARGYVKQDYEPEVHASLEEVEGQEILEQLYEFGLRGGGGAPNGGAKLKEYTRWRRSAHSRRRS